MNRIFFVISLIPHKNHTTRAANVVIYELIRAFAGYQHLDIGVILVFRKDDEEAEKNIDFETRELKKINVKYVDKLIIPKITQFRSKWKKIFFSKAQDFYPEVIYSKILEDKFKFFKPDFLIVPWSPWLTAFCSEINIKKFAYYGNPDHKSFKYAYKFLRKYALHKKSLLDFYLSYFFLRKRHLEMIKKYDFIGNVAENDSIFYTKNGHKNSFYIQNVWIDRQLKINSKKQKLRNNGKSVYKIIGNVGKLDGTANRYGLEIIVKYLAPLLKKILLGIEYEIHILGSGKLLDELACYVDSKEIKLRGFVDDIDKEIIDSDIFLCVNNGSDYKVGHTRYLHAWSLKACVVAHADARLSMPELINNKNCFLGKNILSIAKIIKQILLDENIRMKVSEGGYNTFKKHFEAEAVAKKIMQKLELN